jgi:hypothetical protein
VHITRMITWILKIHRNQVTALCASHDAIFGYRRYHFREQADDSEMHNSVPFPVNADFAFSEINIEYHFVEHKRD